ncbi:membrane-bound lytic murein transglycosylase EmtA, partial [Enterobacter hormaechei]|uniref:membrane-bound lytic murein transglycosylase EmtA n=1 Tax=Enterobacter hormaechei TaxID=158836 RepID=UPI001239D311
AWGVDPQLITAIIAIESGGNPSVVSKSGAVGLMQLKPSTSGRDVYQRMGWRGQPSVSELKNPERTISMGAAYLSILENGPLAGIKDPQVMRYAVVVSYANGAGALLRTFSSNRQDAIDEINDLDADEFFEHVAKKHPAPQA